MSTLLDLPGGNGNYASTPDSAGVSVTGDLDLRIGLSFPDLTPSGNQYILNKIKNTTTREFYSYIQATGIPIITTSPDGTSGSQIVVTCAESFATAGWVVDVIRGWRITVDVDDGAGDSTYTFMSKAVNSHADLKSDAGWSTMGAAQKGGATTSIYDGDSPIEIGSIYLGTAAVMTGKVSGAIIKDGIDGTTVASPDFTNLPLATTTVVDAQGNTWTLNGNAAIAGTYTSPASRSSGALIMSRRHRARSR